MAKRKNVSHKTGAERKGEVEQKGEAEQEKDAAPADKPSDWARLEYQLAHERWTNGTNQRRAGLAFLTTVQGTILTIIGTKLLDMDASARALAVFAIVVAVSGWNHERRIGAYMNGYRDRAVELEQAHGLRLFQYGIAQSKRARTLSNRRLFRWYFVLIVVAWLAALTFDVWKHIPETWRLAL